MDELAPKFSTRISALSDRRRRIAGKLGSTVLLPEDLLLLLEDYLSISLRRRNNALPLFKLQINMLSDLIVAEKALSQYKIEKQNLESKLKASIGDEMELKDELGWTETQIFLLESQVHAVRDIADGMAWRLFEYDRAIMYELANRFHNPHVTTSGLEAELMELTYPFDTREGVAILNDLTHFLKKGDVTIRKDSGNFEFVEVKGERKKSGRITRQKQSLRETVAFLNTGEKEDDGQRLAILNFEIKLKTFFDNIKVFVKKAEEEGLAMQLVSPYLYVTFIDFQSVAKAPEKKLKEAAINEKSRLNEWEGNGDFVMRCEGFDKYLFVRNYVPFSIYPLPERIRIKLMTGVLLPITLVNISEIIRMIKKQGWEILESPEELMNKALQEGDEHASWLATIKRKNLTIQVPGALFGRIGYEFQTAKNLIAALDEISKLAPGELGMAFPNLTGDMEFWD